MSDVFFSNFCIFKRLLSGLVALVMILQYTHAQVDYVIIDSMMVEGNRLTKRDVILREIDLNNGDTIQLSQLSASLNINEKRLLSIGLFTMADLNIKNWDINTGHCNIDISVRENWYIYPYPIFEIADRNFNVWKDEHHYSFDRINYGLALHHINLTGNKDKLKLKFQRGYTQKYELLYEYPYLRGKWGASLNYLYTNNREIIYKTSESKPVFLKRPDESRIFFQHKISVGLTHRTSAKTNQYFKVEWLSANVDKFVSEDKNPDFLGNRRSALSFLSLDYRLKYDNSIYPLYPLGGHAVEFNIRKEGKGPNDEINNFWASLTVENHLPLLKNTILSTKLKAKVNFLDDPMPYFLNTAIGYKNDIITGYQLYVMDGRDFVIFSNAIKFLAIDKNFQLKQRYLPAQFKLMNVKLFGRFNLDYGYARDPLFGDNNFLANKINYGYGPALDLILFNNFTLTCQYGITSFGEKGWFFQTDFNF